MPPVLHRYTPIRKNVAVNVDCAIVIATVDGATPVMTVLEPVLCVVLTVIEQFAVLSDA